MAGMKDQLKWVNQSVSGWARRTRSAVGQWWEEVSAVQERRNEIRELARERHQLLTEMGSKVYTLHRKSKVRNVDLLTDCRRIDEIADEIDRLEQEIMELKLRKAASRPKAVEVEDESPVVSEEDVAEPAAEAPEPEAAEEAADSGGEVEEAAEAEEPAQVEEPAEAEEGAEPEEAGEGEDEAQPEAEV